MAGTKPTIEELNATIDGLSQKMKDCKKQLRSLERLVNKGLPVLTFVSSKESDCEEILTTIYSRKKSYKFKKHFSH